MKYLLLVLLYVCGLNGSVLVGGKSFKYITTTATGYVQSNVVQIVKHHNGIFGNEIYEEQIRFYTNVYVDQQYKGLISTNILICYKDNDVQSFYTAQLANQFWGNECHMLPISPVHMTTGTDHWGTAEYDYFDCFTSLDALSNDYIVPIKNYLDAHQEIKYVANAYKMPYKDVPSPPDTYSLIYQFYNLSGIEEPTISNTSPKLFSFGCRTFEDTTNLLYYTSTFNPFITNGYLIQSDFATNLHAVFPAGNYIGELEEPTIYSCYTNKYLTTAPTNIWFLLYDGFWMGTRDDYLRSTIRFKPYPNSVVMSIESYNFKSYRKGTVRMHQTRLFDVFDKECNGGNYDRIFGCAIGHTMEPGWLMWDVNNFWRLSEQGYSYIDCFYYAGNRLAVSHIVCGNPFLRLSEPPIE